MYLEIDEGFRTHRKTLRFCGLMRDPEAWKYLLNLWFWAVRGAPDGSLAGCEPTDIEIAVQYPKLDGGCYLAMVQARFIDESSEKVGQPVMIHNWLKRTGAAIRRMADEAERKRTYRLHKSKRCGGLPCPYCEQEAEDAVVNVPGQSADTSKDSPADKSSSAADKPHQDKSSQVQTSQVKSSPDLIGGDAPRLRDGPVTGFDLQRVFGQIRASMYGGMPWQSVRVSNGKQTDMAELINADPTAKADVIPTMELLFSKAKLGQAGEKSAEIISNPSFGFGAWCSNWTALREEVHGVAPKIPTAARARPPESIEERRRRQNRETAEAERVRSEQSNRAIEERLKRDRETKPLTPAEQEDVRQGIRSLAEQKSVVKEPEAKVG